MKDKKIINGALILGIGTFIAKLLGALYRVPLTALIGGYGLGLYQMVFPVYSTLLDFSGAGAPSAVSKIISSYKEEGKTEKAKKILKVSLKLFTILGVIGTLIMLFFSSIFAVGQGNADAKFAYITLSPSILFVCLLSCYRGYFQGFMKMAPTAISQIIEQIIKISLGLLFVFLLMPDVKKAVSGATFAITISEIVAFIFLNILYIKQKRKENTAYKLRKLYISKLENHSLTKEIIKYVIPITLTGVIIPISQVADSFIIINLLKKYCDNATILFGLFSGVACTVMNLPVSVCYGIATVAIPAVSSAKNEQAKKHNIKKTIFLTFLVAVPCAVLFYFFSPLIIKILFSKLSIEEKLISSNLLKILTLGIVFLSALQTTNAVLIGKGNIYYPVISMIIGVIVKIILELILINIHSINIYAAAFALIACYFISLLINFILLSKGNKNENKPYNDRTIENKE